MSVEHTVIHITYDSGRKTFLVYWPNFNTKYAVIGDPDLFKVLENLQALAAELHNWPERSYFFEGRTKPDRLIPNPENEPF